MPSPVESTRPVSRTSTSRPYSLIWRLITSLISAGRISMMSDSLLPRVGAAELARQPIQLGANAAVVHGVPHLYKNAAKQIRIDRDLRQYLLAGDLRKSGDDLLRLRFIQRCGAAHSDAHAAEIIVEHPLEVVADPCQRPQALVVGEHFDEARQQVRQRQLSRQRLRQG